jgi:hypothetical protein
VVIALLGSGAIGSSIGLSGDSGQDLCFALFVAILVVAVVATARIFRDAGRAISLRRAVAQGVERSYFRYFIGFFIALFFVILAANIVLPAYSSDILYALLLSVPVLLYYMLGMAFPDGRPAEGLVSSVMYGGAVILNLAVSILGVDLWIGEWAWGLTAAVWALSAFYALFRAPDELEALRT